MRIEQTGIPSRKKVRRERPPDRIEETSPSSDRSLDLLEEIVRMLAALVANDAAVLEKLEEIRYALVDNETGVSNLLKQMKLSNRKLEDLIDKRQ